MGTKKVLVTGCSSGIGLAVAARLAKDESRRFKGKPFTLRMQINDTQVMIDDRNIYNH